MRPPFMVKFLNQQEPLPNSSKDYSLRVALSVLRCVLDRTCPEIQGKEWKRLDEEFKRSMRVIDKNN